MTTASWSFSIDHQSDAGFRAWGSDFSSHLATVGLVQTSDTGQINWTTVTRPGTNTDAGYEIWRFNDTNQSGAPIYIRFGYGTGTAATRPRIRMTVGTGTDGAGTITGTAKTTAKVASEGAGTATGIVSAQSWMCCVDGAFWFACYFGVPNANRVYFGGGIMRTCDSNGTPDATGALVWFMTESNQASYGRWPLRFASTANAFAEVLNNNPAAIVVPSVQTGTVLPNGNNQIFTFWTWTPQAVPLFGKGVVMQSELSPGNTLSVALVGVTARTLLNMGEKFGSAAAPSVSSVTFNTCLIWE